MRNLFSILSIIIDQEQLKGQMLHEDFDAIVQKHAYSILPNAHAQCPSLHYGLSSIPEFNGEQWLFYSSGYLLAHMPPKEGIK